MVRSTLIAAGAMLLCGASFAQQQAAPLYPVTSPVQRGPVINLRTGQPLSAAREAQMRAYTQIVYDNTCTYSVAGYYFGGNPCEDHIDEGRIPGGVGGNNPLGSTIDNNITFFEVSYCAFVATGSVNMQVGFYDNLGQCGGISPVPPPLSTQGTIFQLPVATLPGNGCWTVGFDLGNTGICMPSDGDGIFDNVANLDVFNWSWRMVSGNGGSLLSGEPIATVSGSCTYNIPCSTDPLYGNPCGSGLGTIDSWWVNTDGDPAGGANTNTACSPALGTGCYWFGGHPTGPFSSYWLRLGSNGSCGGCVATAVNYCTAGTTTNGCNAAMTLQSGIPSASNAAPAIVAATGVEGQKTGLIFFGIGQQATPWAPASSSFLCVKSPTLRTAVQATGGTVNACNGSMSIDINAQLAAQTVFPVIAGSVFDIQAWFRDPPAVKTTHLSNGLEIVLCP